LVAASYREYTPSSACLRQFFTSHSLAIELTRFPPSSETRSSPAQHLPVFQSAIEARASPLRQTAQTTVPSRACLQSTEIPCECAARISRSARCAIPRSARITLIARSPLPAGDRTGAAEWSQLRQVLQQNVAEMFFCNSRRPLES